ncbi:hypothetical protein AB4Y90_06835 [Chryseobacterium sp. 2TAF14]|uniref:hypothetical protein n=1 Tax=Chryseobacterium sp. 2TAF14 TaxID=3233007 RepID=UPI003F8F197C
MKKIFSIFLLASLFLAINSCKDAEEAIYEGESLLHFDKIEQNAYVRLSTGNADYLVTYGVLKNVTSNHNVELVFEPAKSTAVLGTDFTIVEGTDVLSAGTAVGDFKINVKESAATAGKKAVFTLKSSSLGMASFDQEVVVNFNLACPIDSNTFPLVYNVDVYAFNEYAPSHQQTLIPVAGTDNQFRINSSWGPSFVAWATNNPSYNNQYLYPGTITINCTNVIFTSGATSTGPGGSGTYNPSTGVIEFTVTQSLFTSPFDTTCTFTPL